LPPTPGRRRRTCRREAGGDRGRHHHRDRGCTVLHLDRAPQEGARAVTATVASPALAGPALVVKVAAERRRRARRRTGVTLALLAAIVVVWALSLMIGRTFYGPGV